MRVTSGLILLCALAAGPLAEAINLLQPLSRATTLGEKLPRPPQWPTDYEVHYTFTLPYESKIQEGGLSIDVKLWRDATNKRSRMDSYNSSNIFIQSKHQDLEITPRIDRLTCLRFQADEEDDLLSAPVLPDLALWEFRGTESLHGEPAGLWVLEQRHGTKHTVYRFFVAHDGTPLRLAMHGNDMFSGAHFDVYIVDYTDFKTGVDPAVFASPEICSNATLEATPSRLRSFPLQMKAYLPFVMHRADEEYDAFNLVHRRRHTSRAEYDMRRSVFHANRNLVDSGLTAALEERSYTMGLNQFADWTQEEFMAVMLPGGGLRGASRNGPGSGEIPYERKVPKGRLPRTVDWRHATIDAQVKDQAACGSCWAFGTTGMLQGAYWLATGNATSFSEQQLVDCSWGYGMNMACGGGDFDAAVDYLAEAGGIVPEASLPYRGADGFCRDAKHDSAMSAAPVKFKGYAMIPPYDDEALMEAVFSRGPLAVTLDAAQPGFRFYSGGVFHSPTCHWKEEDLDHVVTMVGYGTTEEGHDYWLIRNSWSTHWGDDGYVKIARNGNKGRGTDCGLTTSSAYAVYQ